MATLNTDIRVQGFDSPATGSVNFDDPDAGRTLFGHSTPAEIQSVEGQSLRFASRGMGDPVFGTIVFDGDAAQMLIWLKERRMVPFRFSDDGQQLTIG